MIMPVKDSMATAREAITAIMRVPGVDFTVYDDFSTPDTRAELDSMAQVYGFHVLHWDEHTTHPSPNYRLTLQDASRRALDTDSHLVIVESDVTINSDTFSCLQAAVGDGVGMVAAVTVDAEGEINFPYLYARRMHGKTVETHKRFSFCCTLLTHELLKAYNFDQLDPDKQWYDVTISHQSLVLGFRNLLLLDCPVLHRPHSSRPWKQLKYTDPLKYYWQKITQKRDRI